MKKLAANSLLALGLAGLFSAGYAATPPALPRSAAAVTPAAAVVTPVYDGKTLAEDHLAVGNWGGGSVTDSTDLFLFGGHSLKVTTLDFYQGAKIDFLSPVALSGVHRMFQMTLQRGDVTLHYDPQAVSGATQPGQQNNFGGFQGGGGRGRRRGGGGGGQFGRGGGRGGNAAPLIPLITKLRLEFTLADGRRADVLQTIPETADTLAGAGWYSVDVPIASLKFGTGAEAKLKSVTVAGDQYGVFFIGRMQIAAQTAAPAVTAKPAPEEDPGNGADEQNGPPMEGPVFPPGMFPPGVTPPNLPPGVFPPGFPQQGGQNSQQGQGNQPGRQD